MTVSDDHARRLSAWPTADLTTTYGYDGLDRLTSAMQKNSGGGTLASCGYTRDNGGNLTQITRNGVHTTVTYNSANELAAAQLSWAPQQRPAQQLHS